jgi:predicted signal transduction protein with EAL and GGDEF domain
MRLMNRISAEPVMFHGTAIRATASIGYAPMPLPPHNLALSWERALGLIDMALYMAKLHGRNRAYGVKALFRDDAEALTQVERDLEAAWREGIVEIQVLINGPRPPLAPAEMPSNLDLAA